MSKHRTHSTDTQIQRTARLATLAVGIFLGVLAAFCWSRAELPTAGILGAIAATAVIASELIWYCGSERHTDRRASWAEQITEATAGWAAPTADTPRGGGLVPPVQLDDLRVQAALDWPLHRGRGPAELAARRAAIAEYWQQVAAK